MTLLILVGIFGLLSTLFQAFITYFGWKLFLFMKPMKMWTTAWGLFTIAMGLITLRRALAFIMFAQETYWFRIHSANGLWEHLTVGFLLTVVSVLLLIFIIKVRVLFTHYMNGKSKKILGG